MKVQNLPLPLNPVSQLLSTLSAHTTARHEKNLEKSNQRCTSIDLFQAAIACIVYCMWNTVIQKASDLTRISHSGIPLLKMTCKSQHPNYNRYIILMIVERLFSSFRKVSKMFTINGGGEPVLWRSKLLYSIQYYVNVSSSLFRMKTRLQISDLVIRPEIIP